MYNGISISRERKYLYSQASEWDNQDDRTQTQSIICCCMSSFSLLFLGTQEELVKITKALINLEHMPAKHKILHTRISQKHKSSFVDKAFPPTLHYRIEDPDRLLDFENFYKRVALIQ